MACAACATHVENAVRSLPGILSVSVSLLTDSMAVEWEESALSALEIVSAVKRAGFDAELLAAKMTKLRIFSDDNGKMNLSVKDVDGEMLVVSNFTLNANYRHGNRPDYLNSAPPDEANRLYEYFKQRAATSVRRVESGSFGADMKVSIVNNGPVTVCVDSEILRK